MKTSLSISLVLLLLSLFAPPLAGHEEGLPFHTYVVPPQPVSGVTILWEELFGEGATAPDINIVYGPFHGELTPTADGYRYEPRTSLWQAGGDSFVLDFFHQRERRAINVAIAVGSSHKGETERNSFDFPVTGDPDWQIDDPTNMVQVVNSTLLISGNESREDGFIYYPVGFPLQLPRQVIYDDDPLSHPGSSTTGSGTGVLLNPPGGFADPGLSTSPRVFLAAGPTNQADSVKAWVRVNAGIYQVRIGALDELGLPHQSPWVDLSANEPSWLELEYDHPPPGAPDVVRLEVNGKVAAVMELEAGDLPHHLDEFRIGSMDLPEGGAGPSLILDNGEVYRYVIHPAEEPRHTDDFEGLGVWTQTVGTGLTRLLRSKAGRTWLRADLSHGESFLVDAAFTPISRARLRFDVDVTALREVPVKVLALHGGPAWHHANEHVRVLVRSPGEVKVRFKNGGWNESEWLQMPKTGINRVELSFATASGPGRDDGSLRAWINGTEVARFKNLANHQNRVESVRFGAMSVAPNSPGGLFFDNFQLWGEHIPQPCTTPCAPPQ